MKTYKEVPRTGTDRVLDKLKCDICQRDFDNHWDRQFSYEVLETVVKFKTGESFPEGGSGKEIIIDICPECFKRTLVPFIESFGSKIVEKEWDW